MPSPNQVSQLRGCKSCLLNTQAMIFPVNINYVVTLKENRIHLSSLGGTYSKFDNTNPLKFPPASKKQQADKKT
ncbi:hypothetical protein GCM10009795_085790 [Nocardioides hankookensis]|nr:hypothetical protein CWN36_29205 [Klebsiella pneumoniae]BBE04503.1 hypothetical protein KPGSU103_C32210 [Klebsiella pneumoniae]BBO97348.1 hypothetical protein JUNP254_3166 [Klebsiella pneumoniae]BCY37963.1 hypothetical protein TUM12127_31060 [Klebsiella pneumoniae]BCY44835.1 hypothetical protein TUM12128_47450 [Klebsiella pneumoniae]